MAKKPKPTETELADDPAGNVNLQRFLSTKAVFKGFELWIVGDSPLITHAWSEKAKTEMLRKQVKGISAGKAARDPHAEFLSSLYVIEEGVFGFPATAVKKCMLTAAHKDKGIPRETVSKSLWISAPWIQVRPALAGAICDMPIVRIYGGDPVRRVDGWDLPDQKPGPIMREDMVRIGAGIRKTANLAYRAQFTVWAIKVKGRYNASVINDDVIGYLINESGQACGIGDWRNEKTGPFGAFHLADAEESAAWEAFRNGGELPAAPYAMAAE